MNFYLMFALMVFVACVSTAYSFVTQGPEVGILVGAGALAVSAGCGYLLHQADEDRKHLQTSD